MVTADDRAPRAHVERLRAELEALVKLRDLQWTWLQDPDVSARSAISREYRETRSAVLALQERLGEHASDRQRSATEVIRDRAERRREQHLRVVPDVAPLADG